MPKNGRKKIGRAVSRVRTVVRGRRAVSAWGAYGQIERGIGAGRIVQRGSELTGLTSAVGPLVTGAAAVVYAGMRGKIPGAVGALLLDTELTERLVAQVRGIGGTTNGGGI